MLYRHFLYNLYKALPKDTLTIHSILYFSAMKKSVLFLLLLCITTLLSAQDWKEKYKTGWTLWETGAYEQALQTFDRSLALIAKDDPAYTKTLCELADLYKSKGWIDRSQLLYEKALALTKKNPERSLQEYLSLLNTVAVFYHQSGLLAKAELLYLELEKYYTTQSNLTEYPNIVYLQLIQEFFILYRNQGLWQKAEEKIKPVLERLNRYEDTPSHYAHEFTLLLANLYMDQERYSEAITLLAEKVSALTSADAEQGRYYDLLMYAYRDLNESKNVLHYLNLSIEHHKKLYKKNKTFHFEAYGLALFRKAEFYNSIGDYAKAKPLLTQTLAVFEDALKSIHPDYKLEFSHTYKTILLYITSIYRQHNDLAAAEKNITEALTIAHDVYGGYNYGMVAYLNERAALYQQQYKFADAIRVYQQASQILLNNIKQNFSSLSERERQQFYQQKIVPDFNQFNSAGHLAIQQLPSVTEWLYNNRLATKGVLFQSTEKVRQYVLQSSDTTLKATFDVWQLKKNILAQRYQQQASELATNDTLRQRLEKETNELERTLAQHPKIQALWQSQTFPDWKEIQQALNPGESAVEIIRFKKEYSPTNDTVVYAALCIRPGIKHPEYIVLNTGTQLEGKYLSYLRKTIKNDVENNLSYNHYWEPLARHLQQTETHTVYLSTDGVYNLISIDGLYNPNTKKYILDELVIHNVSSTREIVTRIEQPETNTITLVGYPTYKAPSQGDTVRLDSEKTELLKQAKADTVQRFFTGGHVTDLPGTRLEVEEIGALVKRNGATVTQWLERSASEENIKQLNNPHVLHIATHGFFVEDVRSGSLPEYVIQNPLLRSGLLLANCESVFTSGTRATSEDGVLTAYEAMNLQLDRTQLVILSACETGLGEVLNGEGVYGLQRAFRQAGAKQMLMSLWTVSDEATRMLMVSFYKNWLENKQPLTQAFRNARIEIRKTYPNPYYWAAFVLIE
jgi:CHAT domain-containing protein